jgi:hypothetical protein
LIIYYKNDTEYFIKGEIIMSKNINFKKNKGGIDEDLSGYVYSDDIKEYMNVDDVVEKVMANIKSDNPEIDLIIKRPLK